MEKRAVIDPEVTPVDLSSNKPEDKKASAPGDIEGHLTVWLSEEAEDRVYKKDRPGEKTGVEE